MRPLEALGRRGGRLESSCKAQDHRRISLLAPFLIRTFPRSATARRACLSSHVLLDGAYAEPAIEKEKRKGLKVIFPPKPSSATIAAPFLSRFSRLFRFFSSLLSFSLCFLQDKKPRGAGREDTREGAASTARVAGQAQASARRGAAMAEGQGHGVDGSSYGGGTGVSGLLTVSDAAAAAVAAAPALVVCPFKSTGRNREIEERDGK